jgi:osmoprotectant transport system ATP-binding protein
MNKALKLKDIMETDIFTVSEEDSIVDVLQQINDNKVGYVPVLDDNGKLSGLITRSSLITVLSTQFLEEEDNA